MRTSALNSACGSRTDQQGREIAGRDHIVGEAEIRPPDGHPGIGDQVRMHAIEDAMPGQRRDDQPQRPLDPTSDATRNTAMTAHSVSNASDPPTAANRT